MGGGGVERGGSQADIVEGEKYERNWVEEIEVG